MVARANALFRLTPETSMIVAAVGCFTAFLAATIALVQNDIKRVLAYSTVSQLGFMFMAAGVGAYGVAIFHLYTHAFFKALLFLGSGSVIHALSGEQDMRKMGALKDKIPVTFRTMFIGSLAIAGIPGLAGFFSKDEILWQIYSSPIGSRAIWAVAAVTAFMTAFYMWRLMFMTFYGTSRVEPKAAAHIHESPKVMTVPLMVLAAGSVLAGWIGVPKLWSAFGEGFRIFEHWLAPVVSGEAAHAAVENAHHDTSVEWLLMSLSVAIALAGIALARYLYIVKPASADAFARASGPLYGWALNKWSVDEAYDFLFVNGLAKGGGTVLGSFDKHVVDGGVNGTGWLTRFTSRLSIWWDTWIVDGAVRLTSFLVMMSSFPARILQTGFVQSYALVFVLGVVAIFGYVVMR
jgi:NADH-quinone oxidoreductase subunit L